MHSFRRDIEIQITNERAVVNLLKYFYYFFHLIHSACINNKQYLNDNILMITFNTERNFVIIK